MTKPRLGKPRLRAFIALELPAELKRRIVVWRERKFDPEAGFRLLGLDKLHLTLVFLGYQYERDLPRLAATIETDLPESPFRLRVAQLVAIGGSRQRGRAFALQLHDDEALAAWQGALVERLAATGLHEPEQRAFWPHVTVTRSRANARLRAPDRADELPPELLEPFDTDRLTLYRSTLRRSGAIYEPLAQFGSI